MEKKKFLKTINCNKVQFKCNQLQTIEGVFKKKNQMTM